MPIRRLLEDHAFGPDEIEALVTAFEGALTELRLFDRNDPLTNLVAKNIIRLAQQGERDPVRLRDLTVKALSG